MLEETGEVESTDDIEVIPDLVLKSVNDTINEVLKGVDEVIDFL